LQLRLLAETPGQLRFSTKQMCELSFIGTAHVLCGAGFMHLSGVRQSGSQQQTRGAADLLLWAWVAGDIDRLLHGAWQCGV